MTAAPCDKRAFLSIFIRTQGVRTTQLREVLSCLEAQENQDFEVLLFAHKVADERLSALEQLIEGLSEGLKQQITLHTVLEGNRATPLNRGLSLAHGQYCVALDDDDLVLPNWVSTFASLAAAGQTAVSQAPLRPAVSPQATALADAEPCLRSKCCIQNWKHEPKPHPEGNLLDIYDDSFSLARTLAHNNTPFMSIAFPLDRVRQAGLQFDETMLLLEDWDFLTRAALAFGVADSGIITCIYRAWLDGRNSQTEHDMAQWEHFTQVYSEHFAALPPGLPAGSACELRELFGDEASPAYKCDRDDLACARLFLDTGEGFNELLCIHQFLPKTGVVHTQFAGLESWGQLRRIRFDPTEEGRISLDGLSLCLEWLDGTRQMLSGRAIVSNGRKRKAHADSTRAKVQVEGFDFVYEDPQLIIDVARLTRLLVLAHRDKGRVPSQLPRLHRLEISYHLSKGSYDLYKPRPLRDTLTRLRFKLQQKRRYLYEV